MQERERLRGERCQDDVHDVSCGPGRHGFVSKLPRNAMAEPGRAIVLQERGGLRGERRQDELHQLSRGLCRHGFVSELPRVQVPGSDGQVLVQELRLDVRSEHEVCGVHRQHAPVLPSLHGQHVAEQPLPQFCAV